MKSRIVKCKCGKEFDTEAGGVYGYQNGEFTCPTCWAEEEAAFLRGQCMACGKPLAGEEPLCHCYEEREPVCQIAPKSRTANRNGGTGHGWLRGRRGRVGY